MNKLLFSCNVLLAVSSLYFGVIFYLILCEIGNQGPLLARVYCYTCELVYAYFFAYAVAYFVRRKRK